MKSFQLTHLEQQLESLLNELNEMSSESYSHKSNSIMKEIWELQHEIADYKRDSPFLNDKQ